MKQIIELHGLHTVVGVESMNTTVDTTTNKRDRFETDEQIVPSCYNCNTTSTGENLHDHCIRIMQFQLRLHCLGISKSYKTEG
jgi:hypothetical protein